MMSATTTTMGGASLALEGQSYNACFQHPFTMCVTGPSGSGKSTFVSQLLTHKDSHISGKKFSYVYFVIGTAAKQNTLFLELASYLKKNGIREVQIWELNQMYSDDKDRKRHFPTFLDATIKRHSDQGEAGCLILDDLMKEMADMDLLTHAFTRMSTHQSVSVIFITQNLFYQGKAASVATTIYRNTKHMVLFVSRVDKSIIRYIVQRMGSGKNNQKLRNMIEKVLEEHRYLVINFDFARDSKLMFTTALFEQSQLFAPKMTTDVPHQTVIVPNFEI